MKCFYNEHAYDYPFSAVSLAYFLRYPNRYSRHVLSTDVIEQFIDPNTHRLHSTRLHLKRTKIPLNILKLVPKRLGGSDHSAQSYILETSVIDPTQGWMKTESRNLEWTGILSVVERQHYQRLLASENAGALDGISLDRKSEQTTVYTNVTLRSRFGQGMVFGRRNDTDKKEEDNKTGLLSSLSAAGIERTIELIGVRRTRDAVSKGKQGMNLVLERLRSGGIMCVLEGIRQDRKATLGP
ncbi:hypothetical protein N7532_001727 [Penicillium argentinense]|uniref:PRELI/MSF1 domain-containing protein n=1 Tax=Penicillium argentinense TaxID=1131581 RepID=A0A9W9G363_9EURO|nr:uncharacterized protein N7532_001727 [Penicillium argentinense]KAJ5111192.1 hypothetical protein N7532_001727 [Penicillium argentinense]